MTKLPDSIDRDQLDTITGGWSWPWQQQPQQPRNSCQNPKRVPALQAPLLLPGGGSVNHPVFPCIQFKKPFGF